MSNKSIVWAFRSLFCLVVALTLTLFNAPMRYTAMAASPDNDHIATRQEARTVAENWLRLIVERDGQWSGEKHPAIDNFTEFKRGDLLLGYYASVKPQGYIIIAALKDFAPIQAYSTDSNLDPNREDEKGMGALLKDVLERRISLLIERFGGLDQLKVEEIGGYAPQANRRAWSYLLEGGSTLRSNLLSMNAQVGRVGPLLRTSWHQRPPYNNECPNMGCTWDSYGNFNQNAVVGCVPLAMAQIMRYYAWPPYFDEYYDWPNMLNRYKYENNWFVDQNGHPVTQAQIDAVADLCADAGSVIHIDYGCSGTGAFMCNWAYDDARDAFEDHFFYSNPGNDEPQCEERDSYDFNTWWNMIREEIDHNRPMMYRIANHDFDHLIVVDGYDNTGGQYLVHANYGWDDGHTAWYTLDQFDCNGIGACDWGSYEMTRFIYPRTGLCGVAWVNLGPRNSATDLHHYVYCDVTLLNVTIQGGAWVQFLPGTSIMGGSASIEGRSPAETRLFSDGLPTRGLKVAGGGKIKLYPSGSIRVH
ncbi:MAG: C10 family peptidase [Anaerolineae bacterium]|nr:C10 family peptidase [Anaerolineae bacterium]